MYWIELHNQPEILKLGFGSMALYGEPKPGIGDAKPGKEEEAKVFLPFLLKLWQQSRIAYLKEPEFKVKQEVYHGSQLVTITYKRSFKHEENEWFVCDKSNPIRHESYIVKESELSHYSLGQQVESFKYVRWWEEEQTMSGYQRGWQEVEEPAKSDFHELEDGIPSFEIEKWREAMEQFQADIKLAKILAYERTGKDN